MRLAKVKRAAALIIASILVPHAVAMSVQGISSTGALSEQELESPEYIPTPDQKAKNTPALTPQKLNELRALGLDEDNFADRLQLEIESRTDQLFQEQDDEITADMISTWVDWWENYSTQFTPNDYRREVVGDACTESEQQEVSATDVAKTIACRQHLQTLYPRSAEDQLQELADEITLDPEDQPYFCPEQYPHPKLGGRRCIASREFDFSSGWIHTKVDRSSPLYPDTTISYAVESGPCTVTVGGVITPTDGGVCVVKATERFNAGLSRDSNLLELTIVDDRCHDADVPFVLTAAQQDGSVNVPVQLTASGGGLAACQAGHSDHTYFVTPIDRCSLNDENQLTATLPGECSVTAYASGLINESYAQSVTVSFSDPEATNRTALALSVEATHVGRNQNIVATVSDGLHVNGSGAHEYGLVVQGSSCGSATSLGEGRYSFGPRENMDSATCRIYATNVARVTDGLLEETDAICITIGAGGLNVPEGCEGTVAPAEFASYGALNIECWSPSPSDNPCHRASGSIAIADANDLSLTNFTLQSVSGSANENCDIDSPTRNVRQTNANQPAACHVEAVREGNTSNALCLSFGDMVITDPDTCTGEASIAGFSLSVSNSGPEIGEAVTVRLTTDRPAVGNEQILLRMVSNYPGCNADGAFYAFNTSMLERSVTCTEDQGAPLTVQFIGEFLEQTETIDIVYQRQ